MRLTEAQWKVMECAWKLKSCTVRDVVQALEGQDDDGATWSYSTVKTLLTRLADKGALKVDDSQHANVFRPAIARESTRKGALRQFVHRTFGGQWGLLAQNLVDELELTEEQRAELTRLLSNAGTRDE